MRKKMVFVIYVTTEEIARQKAEEWYAEKPNLTVDKVKPYIHGGYQVSISYDEKGNDHE